MNALRHRQPRGVAVLTAIIMLALLGVALATLSRSFAQQAQRTCDGCRDAQLRQLLQAGAASVAEKSRAWPADVAEQNWTVPLPKTLSDSAASLSISLKQPAQAGNPSAMTASVAATVDKFTARQTLTISRIDGHWRITDGRLGE